MIAGICIQPISQPLEVVVLLNAFIRQSKRIPISCSQDMNALDDPEDLDYERIRKQRTYRFMCKTKRPLIYFQFIYGYVVIGMPLLYYFPLLCDFSCEISKRNDLQKQEIPTDVCKIKVKFANNLMIYLIYISTARKMGLNTYTNICQILAMIIRYET